ncbi:MAG: rRNA maturation RNase YbeY [Clostridia bacterium]|nr:rRNA maturation RNase YbeY [Clostridia bacterium]
MSVNAELYIENEQNLIDFDEKMNDLVSEVVKMTLECEGFNEACYVSVTVTDNERIHELNREFRNIDRATDVLSFPVLEFDENGNMIENSGDYYEGRLILGDIVLSAERALEQSRDFGHSFEREVGFLVCHSMLHLLGYDHETEDERAVMRRKEEYTLEKMGLTR